MKKLLILVAAFALVGIVVNPVLAKKPGNKKCTTIQSGELRSSTGEILTTGFDEYGYNYQAHQYIGLYGNYQRPAEPTDEGYKLMMKWNDGWLSNQDCSGDDLLDRHYGYDSYIGSGAWLTNHMSGEYVDENEETCHWTYFVKIVAAPEDAVKDGGIWYTAEDEEIGPVIWGSFAIIQEVENDPCASLNGVQYLSPVKAGLGNWASEIEATE
jgi:hypothetical protein